MTTPGRKSQLGAPATIASADASGFLTQSSQLRNNHRVTWCTLDILKSEGFLTSTTSHARQSLLHQPNASLSPTPPSY